MTRFLPLVLAAVLGLASAYGYAHAAAPERQPFEEFEQLATPQPSGNSGEFGPCANVLPWRVVEHYLDGRPDRTTLLVCVVVDGQPMMRSQ